MAFPTTSVLTSFPGADEDPLSEGGAWAASTIRLASATIGRCRLLSNVAAHPVDGNFAGESVWATQYAADQECFATITALPTAGTNGYAVWVRIQSEGTAGADGYMLSYNRTIGLRIFKMLNSAVTQVGTTTDAGDLAIGDSIGISGEGTTIKAWRKPAAGAWSNTITETDSNVTGAGKIGVLISAGSSVRVDDFGNGEVVAGVDVIPLRSQHLDYDYSR